MFQRRRWPHIFFITFTIFHFSFGQQTLISSPCLQSCFIKECQDLESLCVCRVVSTVSLSMAAEACNDGGAALRALASECRVPLRFSSPGSIIRTPARPTTSITAAPQPMTANQPQTLDSRTAINAPAATGIARDQAPLAPPLPPPPAPTPPGSVVDTTNTETTPSAPPIVPPASNAPTESQETQVQLKKSVVIVISLSVAAVFLLFIFIWYRRKMGPSWYKFGGTWEWDWAAWRKERERNRALVNKRRRRGSIQTFMGPPPEYETRLAWDFPAPAAPAAGLAIPQMAQVRIPR